MLQITIKYYSENKIIYVEYSDKINIIGNKIDINLIFKDLFGYYKSEIAYIYEGKKLNKNKTFFEENIKNNSDILLFTAANMRGAGSIDNLMNENAKNIGFDMRLIQRDELYINLIYFDSKMTNEENYSYSNNFKVNVVGGFHAIDDLNIFEAYLKAINNKNINFIVISSGSDGKNVINLCLQYPFIKEVIIFCRNYKYNEHYLTEYPGYVKKIFTTIESLHEYLKKFDICEFVEGISNYFSFEQIQTNKQLELCPLITAKEYDKCYFLIHKAYSYFFDNISSNDYYSNSKRFSNIYQTKILDYLFEAITRNNEKIKILNILLLLVSKIFKNN